MAYVVAAFDAEGYATKYVASEPAAEDTGAPLAACHFKSGASVSFFATAWALHGHG